MTRQLRRWLAVNAVASVAVVAGALPATPAFAATYQAAPMTKCAGTNASGNTTTVTFIGGGKETLAINTCISRDAVTHLYSFWVSLTWTDSDNNRGSLPYDAFKIHVVEQNTNITTLSKDCDVLSVMNAAGTSGSTSCKISNIKLEGNSGFNEMQMTADGYVQWNLNRDGLGWLPVHNLYGSPSFVANEFTDHKDTNTGCVLAIEKPKKYSDGRVYYRAASACPISVPLSYIVILTVELAINGHITYATYGHCSDKTLPFSVSFCSIEGSQPDPSGSQSYQTAVDQSRIDTATGGFFWVMPQDSTVAVVY
jgi:hypothetical protein